MVRAVMGLEGGPDAIACWANEQVAVDEEAVADHTGVIAGPGAVSTGCVGHVIVA